MNGNTVSVIDTATNTVTATVTVGIIPIGVAVNPSGTEVYVANKESNTVSVIDTATNTVIAMVPVGTCPVAIGQFIVPAPPIPTVTSVSPNYGPPAGGNSVTITGTGLTGATKVTFGATPVSLVHRNQ